MSNVVLIGFMGVGKSQIGKLLARAMKMEFVDTDELIEKETGISIAQIFEQQGEGNFRQLESKVVAGVSELDNTVIATGGGVVLRNENMERLKKNGIIIYIHVTEDELSDRIRAMTDRPLLSGADKQEKMHELLRARGPLYRKYADFIVDGEHSFDSVMENIKDIVSSNGYVR